MAREKLDVFISSDQKEFSKERTNLAEAVCAIPFLTCTLLENKGADSADILEASLKGVRDSDIYVGIFGRKYSQITLREYGEAVRNRKPCLIYLKKARNRDVSLKEFVEQELTGQFKYHEFRDLPSLTQQVERDLNRFIFETIEIGLATRAQKKTEAETLIHKGQVSSRLDATLRNPLAKANEALQQGRTLESLIYATTVLEVALRNVLKDKKKSMDGKSLGFLLKAALDNKIISVVEVTRLREISYLRNAAVHQGDIPSRDKVAWIIENVQRVLERLPCN